jgi:hypothetical protein
MTEDEEDSRMRALFGDVARPPFGDDAFVKSVMARVAVEKSAERARRSAFSMGALAFIGASLWPFRDPIALALTGAFDRVLIDLPSLSAGATTLLVAAVVSAAAWAYAERV